MRQQISYSAYTTGLTWDAKNDNSKTKSKQNKKRKEKKNINCEHMGRFQIGYYHANIHVIRNARDTRYFLSCILVLSKCNV